MTDKKKAPDNATEDKALPDDPIVTFILNAVADGKEISPNHVAQRIAADRFKEGDPKDAWRKYMTAVRQQAISLARNGRLDIMRKGEVADPNDFKGLYKLRLPKK